MVPEFDVVIWNEAVGEVHGPVKTAFGYHLIEIVSREG
jgi:peptidyl-prolyl cis-trans isomerase C